MSGFWGALVGGLFGGPWGAVVGGVLGSMFDDPAQKDNTENQNGGLTVHDADFDAFDQGIRGMAIPYTLRAINVKNNDVTVFVIFLDENGNAVKSLVEELAAEDGNLLIGQVFHANRRQLNLNERIFVPYGVFDVSNTQVLTARVLVYVDDERQVIFNKDFQFTYNVYDSDQREYDDESDDEEEIFEATLGVIAHVIKADGVTAPEEIRTVISFFSSPEVDREHLKERLKFHLKNLPDLDECCEILCEMSTQNRFSLIGLLLNISVADGIIHPAEIETIENVARNLGISECDLASMKMDFISSRQKLYALFDLKIGASKEEIKAAYRLKCKEFHPDQYQNLPAGMRKLAEEKFKELQNAYEELTKR